MTQAHITFASKFHKLSGMAKLSTNCVTVAFIFTIITLGMNSIVLFSSPSRTNANTLIEFNLASSTSPEAQGVYRFGLWGYCFGTYTAFGSFEESECTKPKSGYIPNFSDLIYTKVNMVQSDDTLNNTLISDINKGQVSTGFKGIIAGFILSVIECLCVLVTIFLVGTEYGIWPLTLCAGVGLAQWITLAVGLNYTRISYDGVYQEVSSRSSLHDITVSKDSKNMFNIGWAGFAMSIISFLVLILVLGFEIRHLRFRRDKVFLEKGDMPTNGTF